MARWILWNAFTAIESSLLHFHIWQHMFFFLIAYVFTWQIQSVPLQVNKWTLSQWHRVVCHWPSCSVFVFFSWMFPRSVELISNKEKRWIVSSCDSVLAPLPPPVVWTCWWPSVATMLMKTTSSYHVNEEKMTSSYHVATRLVACKNAVKSLPSIHLSIQPAASGRTH